MKPSTAHPSKKYFTRDISAGRVWGMFSNHLPSHKYNNLISVLDAKNDTPPQWALSATKKRVRDIDESE